MEAIRAIANRVAVMDSGRILEQGDVYDVFSAPRTDAAARFVRTVLRDRPSQRTLQRLRAAHPGRIVSVKVTEERGFQGRISRDFATHDVDAEIIYGGIGDLRDRPVGSLTLELTGGGDVDAALAALRAGGVTVVEELLEAEGAR